MGQEAMELHASHWPGWYILFEFVVYTALYSLLAIIYNNNAVHMYLYYVVRVI